MSAMTLGQIRTQVQGTLDIVSGDIPVSVLDTFIAQGFDAIVYSEKRWPFYEVSTTFSTVGGQSDYPLSGITVDASSAPGGSATQPMREIFSLRTDNQICGYIGRDLGDSRNPLDSVGSGSPRHWSYWGDSVRFYPTPSGVETIYVRGVREAVDFPSSLDGNATSDVEPDLPDPFQPLLASYAASKAYLQQEDPQMAAQYGGQFRGELDNIARRYADSPAPQPMLLNRRGRGSNQLVTPMRFQNANGVIF